MEHVTNSVSVNTLLPVNLWSWFVITVETFNYRLFVLVSDCLVYSFRVSDSLWIFCDV